ncbi:hypothetical protein [Stenotrophomonas tumulicola]|uniref:Uncharacterized protein n=1 Tax=Stenotrophomonas tumulicola TaxID=1685415 RepID=A0A7W3FJ95_9GAMM|nr:hypothetical protein [Stenotrophomonas tumulicola]MBA8680515.1 hypothetical protein [Stenotrophomonas tumulicola]
MTWVATAITLIGAATQQYTQHKANSARDDRLAQQIRTQSANQDRANAAVNDLLTQRATDDGAVQRDATERSFLDQAQAAQLAAGSGLRQPGAVSDAYRTAANDAALGIGDYSRNAASLMARMDAPRQQRRRESLQSGNLATQLGLIGRQSQSDDYLSNLQLQSVQADPWLSAAGMVAQGVGRGVAGRAGSAASTAGTASGFGSEASNWYTNPKLWGR